MEPETFENIVNTNLTGLWYCCHAAAQHMLRQGHGNIINIVLDSFGAGGFEGRTPGYFASKGGVNNLSSCSPVSGPTVASASTRSRPTSSIADDPPILTDSGCCGHLEARTPMRRIGQAATS